MFLVGLRSSGSFDRFMLVMKTMGDRLMALVVWSGWDTFGVTRKGCGWFGTQLVVME